ncbi:deoxyguanosinetriphosphate triphosphohydrolase family protein [Acinetobacter sp. ANC 4635]|uniref:anti-phage deoxyguanosine triphosphatase n=1 Tax=Acinetobacter sp. ANC 4635 TaxID=2529846 RepID=UPI00103A51FF|nr:anti-phage deoxyguanosine triphosphatase [Acinetobacter sp. ANC 4635]TCB30104.1 deoxyguanosinetriphosphate triphosphohydrolase family protein [Acinetobacter sp. ANC 4635]
MNQSIWEERCLKQKKKDNDVRNEWERDYARLIHSAAFRRLQAKTQVLGLGESDFYRTRLTHSMEVAQIGVGIVRWLREGIYTDKSDEETIKEILPRSSLINAICLAHDLGHPPFGHGGEVALNICMRNYGGFEGNGQTLRILSKLEKYTENNGMNPTRRLLLGVLKYPVSYTDACNKAFYGKVPVTKWLAKANEQKPPKCYLDTEKELVDWILEKLPSSDRELFVNSKAAPKKHFKPLFHSLDASIMELADDISYSLHDFEDAISLGLITLKEWNEYGLDKEEIFSKCNEDINQLGNELFSENTYKRKSAIGRLVHRLITNIYLKEKSEFDEPLLKWNAELSQPYAELREHIFKIVYKEVIKSPNVQLLEFKGQKIVIELFEALSSDPDRLLPKSKLENYSQAQGENEKMRVICDYIAGMTDEYATRLYEKIYSPHKGSIFDHI